MIAPRRLFRFMVLAFCVSPCFVRAAREVVDTIVATVNGEVLTLSQVQKPHIITNGAPMPLEQHIALLLWQQRARERHIEAPNDDVLRSISRYKEDNGMVDLDDAQADRLLKGQIGLTFAEYKQQLEQHFMIELFKSYEFRNRCSVGEYEVRSYFDAHPSVEPAQVKFDLASLTAPQQEAFQHKKLDTEGLAWDSFDFMHESDIAPHLKAALAGAAGSCALAFDAEGEPLLVRVVERKEAHAHTLSERYHAIELALQREKIARYAAESEEGLYKDAVIQRFSLPRAG